MTYSQVNKGLFFCLIAELLKSFDNKHRMNRYVIGFEKVRLEIELDTPAKLPSFKLNEKSLIRLSIHVKLYPLCLYQLEIEKALSLIS